MRTKFTIAVRAARDLACALGACALGCFFAVERSWLWLLPAVLVVLMLAGIFYRIEESLAARRDRQLAGLRVSRRRATDAVASLQRQPLREREPLIQKPPKSAKYTWTLTENGVPVGVEYDRRAVDNWMALGEGFDAVAHKLN